MRRRDFVALAGSAALAAPRPPNVVVIYADDLGYGDLGCYGSPLRTPNLDRIAAEGVRFTHHYSAAPACSPSRSALLTGRYPTRVGVPHVLMPPDRTGLADGETTIAQMLKPLGYRTACVGKWHVGHQPQYLPDRRGFDSYFGIPYSNDMTPRPLWRQQDGRTEVVEAEATLSTLTERYTAESVRFVKDSASQPFFLYLPHTYPHIPLDASAKFKGKSQFGIYGDVLEELDASVGSILDAVRSIGQERNTLVLFSSDNGPWFQGSPGKLRGRKGSTYEGGVRVPFLARMPGRVAKGKTVSGVTSMMDILPTVAALTGAPLPNVPLDGLNIWPLLEGRGNEIEREALLMFDGWQMQAARWKQWKLQVSQWNSYPYSAAPAGGRVNLPLRPPELYDLTRDVDESYDVAARHPDVVKEIEGRINRLLQGFPAPVRQAWGETLRSRTGPQDAGRLPRLAN